ncbi:hypothetical protein QR680_004824 [Steinernema hermaphroditum]|uniref:UDP-glucuronosyltransferase n=1 Tax=Steinernema hermaphroditum TaxID=289476 RepID=A0AA39HPY5_9BILA|nr:hypothetical protein QR680_004824 [Steinernema hermaphroditum]
MFRHFPDYIFIFSFKLKGWAPQREIIAHKRTVLFFTHGGLKSLKEAICAETPLLVLPFFADQIPNAVNMRHLGFAESLIKTELSTEVMVAQIRKMVTNRAYKEKIKKIKAIFVDRVMDPQEEGVFWTERILRSSRGLTFPIRGSTMTYVEILNLDVLALASLTLPLLLWRLLEVTVIRQSFPSLERPLLHPGFASASSEPTSKVTPKPSTSAPEASLEDHPDDVATGPYSGRWSNSSHRVADASFVPAVIPPKPSLERLLALQERPGIPLGSAPVHLELSSSLLFRGVL